MQFRYERENVTASQFADLLDKSGLASRRPANDAPRLQRMLDNANLIVTARLAETGQLGSELINELA